MRTNNRHPIKIPIGEALVLTKVENLHIDTHWWKK